MDLLNFVKDNRQEIANLCKVPPPVVEKSLFSDISEHMYNVMAGKKYDVFVGGPEVTGKEVADIQLQRVKNYRGVEEEDFYMDEEYQKATGLTPDMMRKYLDENDPYYVVCGEEFSSIFITDVDHPAMISNWMTWNDEYFFGCKVHNQGQAREYVVNGKKLLIYSYNELKIIGV